MEIRTQIPFFQEKVIARVSLIFRRKFSVARKRAPHGAANSQHSRPRRKIFVVEKQREKIGVELSGVNQEAINVPFCHSQEKFHNVVLEGVRNISDTFKIPLCNCFCKGTN